MTVYCTKHLVVHFLQSSILRRNTNSVGLSTAFDTVKQTTFAKAMPHNAASTCLPLHTAVTAVIASVTQNVSTQAIFSRRYARTF